MKEASYTSPFSARYASREMSYLFSAQSRAVTFRKLWIALAKGERALGLPISEKQIEQMEKAAEQIDFAAVHAYEKQFRHDVMAHIHAFGDLCPEAKPILHLGATSSYVTDNGDLIQLREALRLLLHKLISILRKLSHFAATHAHEPCLSYTHFQSAQPTTIGKRACLWLQDLLLDALEWERVIDTLPFLGAKGATGTQASFLSLFEGQEKKVLKLEQLIAEEFGFTKVLPIAGQTYTRKLDIQVIHTLGSFAASAHKLATDVRLLAHDGELVEGFGDTQVGSSAMPYKRNPIYSERICGLARFVISLTQNPTYTAATQWLERSLDDSSNRRLSIPESFLGADALLNLLSHLIDHWVAHPAKSLELLKKQLPHLSMENILMLAVKKGGDRQHLHEHLRQIAMSSEGKVDPLHYLETELEKKPFSLNAKELKPLLAISALVGRAPAQVTDFLSQEVEPFLSKYRSIQPQIPSIEV